MHASVGNQTQHATVTGHFLNAHLNTGMNRAHQDIDFVTLYQLVGVFNAFRWLGLVIHLEEFNFTATQFAALFVQRHAETVFNRHAQLRKRAGVGQHQADAQFPCLRLGLLRNT